MPKASPLPLLPNENIVFNVRSSTFVIIIKIIGLAILDIFLTLFFIKLDIAKILQLENYRNFINIIPSIAIGVLAIIFFLDWLTTKYTLTNRRVETTRGIFGISSQSMAVEKINSIFEYKSLPGRIFNYGTLIIKSASLGFQINFQDIGNSDLRKKTNRRSNFLNKRFYGKNI